MTDGQDQEIKGRGRPSCLCLSVLQDRKPCILFTGVYTVVTSLLCLLFVVFRMSTNGVIYKNTVEGGGLTQLKASYVLIVIYGIMMFCALCLIVGGRLKDNRFCLLPWLLFSAISVIIEFWFLIVLFKTHTRLKVFLGNWEIVFLVFFAVRLFIQCVCFLLMIIHGRRMFKIEKKKNSNSSVDNLRRIPQLRRHVAPPIGQAVLPVTVASPSYFTVTSAYVEACPLSPPPYADTPPMYSEIIPVSPEQSSVI